MLKRASFFCSEFERRGIDAGEQKGLALVRISKGMRKHFEDQQVVTMQNFHDVEDVFPVSLSLVVQVNSLLFLFFK